MTQEQYTPMIQAYLDIKNQYLDKLVFYRMGDFYELFFEDAIIASKILNITLTQRSNANGKPIEMAGVPFHAVDTYIQKAVQNGYSVVICEQMGDANTTKGLIQREVTKIITPGTIIDSGILEDKEIKFLASIYKRGESIDIAWINFSSGEIWCKQVSHKNLFTELQKINPSEILISDKQFQHFSLPKFVLTQIADWEYDLILSKQKLEHLFGKQYIHQYGLIHPNISSVISTLLSYLKETQCHDIIHIQNIKWVKDDDFLIIDYNSNKQLEITESSNEYTLWKILDFCSTNMGSRKLKNWLYQPSRNLSIIHSRLDRVQCLLDNKLYASWKNIAKDWCDIERITTRISLKSVKPRELTYLRTTLRSFPKLISWAEKLPPNIRGYFEHSIPTDAVLKLLEKYLLNEPSVWIRDGNVIADGVDQELDECRNLQKGHSDFLKKFEEQQKIDTQIANLKVEYNQAQGFFISISNSHLHKIPAHYKRKQTLKNGERFTTDTLLDYEEKALSANDRALKREKFLYNQLLDKLKPYISILQKQASVLSEWDVLNAFAEIAEKFQYSKPLFVENTEFIIQDGRHPIIERFQQPFIPNSYHLNQEEKIMIITGPNMGGKSTIMRQTALIAIMAHIGSFVPAQKCILPIFDSIFTRIGANDDLVNGRSTFMVEMNECSYILNNATEKSLVLIDELGRGTATYDGLSLAWSITEFLSQKLKPYTIFATHYLEMTSLPEKYSNIVNYHVSAIDQGEKIIFTHFLEKGAANKSYGIHVADLAGLPSEVIENAKNKLDTLETKKTNQSSSQNCSCEQEILSLEILQMSPLQALEWLYKKQIHFKNFSQS